MHLLSRPIAPKCLAKYSHGKHSWGDLTTKDKEEIRAALNTMQAKRCAYCERSLPEKTSASHLGAPTFIDAHIEHFRQKNPSIYPQGTFLWTNLFLSCNDSDSCGRHKDNKIGAKGYQHSDLIKMDQDDPDDFLHFISDGTINVRSELSKTDAKRAEETIRVFNLDKTQGNLRARRREAARPFLENADALVEMTESAQPEQLDQIREFYIESILAARDLEFFTTIRHTLIPYHLHRTLK